MARLVVEVGLGVDLVGEDVHVSIERAINDIVHRVCIPFFREKGLRFEEAEVVVDVYTPYPERVDLDRVADMLPVKPGKITINVHYGGAVVHGLNHIIASIVALTINIP
jgi:uncharacterized protein (TIGR02058 family)